MVYMYSCVALGWAPGSEWILHGCDFGCDSDVISDVKIYVQQILNGCELDVMRVERILHGCELDVNHIDHFQILDARALRARYNFD